MISVIVPVYKVEPYLRQCVDSILNQTYRDIEVLLIDDGSPDRCGEICDEYARKDKRVRVFHTENKGLSAARNLGLREAKGEYIGFVDSDDWIEPDMYEVLLTRLEENGADISVCGVWYEYKETRQNSRNIKDTIYADVEIMRAFLFQKLSNTSWNKLYKKELWTDIWFPDGHVQEDVVTICEVCYHSHVVLSCSDNLYHYRQREGSIVHINSMKNLMDYWNAYRCLDTYISSIPELISDEELAERLSELVAYAAVKTWRYIHGVAYEQRDYNYLSMVSQYVKSHYPLFGYKEWKFYMRVGVFFVRFVNNVSFSVLFFLNKAYKSLVRKNRFPKQFYLDAV